MIAGGGDLMQKGARRLRPVEDSQEGGQAGSSSWSWGEFLCSNLIQSGRMGVISWYYRITKTVKSYQIISSTRWPLSSKETLRKRPVEESRCPSPLVRSNTLSSIQRPEKLDQVNSANLLFELWSLVSYVIEFVAQNNCREGHWYMMVLGQYRAVLAGIWWITQSRFTQIFE